MRTEKGNLMLIEIAAFASWMAPTKSIYSMILNFRQVIFMVFFTEEAVLIM